MAILLAVQTAGLRRLAADLKAADRKLPRHLARRLKEAGEIIAVDARRRAGYSTRIPGTIRVTGGATSVSVKAGGDAAPHAAALEGADGNATFRHPVFRSTVWVTQPTRPFLRPAATANAERAAVIVSKVIDDFTRDAGFR